jgi:hypothetical protein
VAELTENKRGYVVSGCRGHVVAELTEEKN